MYNSRQKQIIDEYYSYISCKILLHAIWTLLYILSIKINVFFVIVNVTDNQIQTLNNCSETTFVGVS